MTDTERIAAALERIADALEAQNAADPLTMLSMAMGEESAPQGVRLPCEPQNPFASNGATLMYRHPVEGYEIVARRDESCEGGYSVRVQAA
jgi:hypothetical protein